jgi:large-conductance mechanosensitive channel
MRVSTRTEDSKRMKQQTKQTPYIIMKKDELLSTIIAFGIMAVVIYIGHLYGLELEKINY